MTETSHHAAATRQLLVLDPDPAFGRLVCGYAAVQRYEGLHARSVEEARHILDAHAVRIAFVDATLAAHDDDPLAALGARRGEIVAVLTAARTDAETVIRAMRLGAYDYLDKGCGPGELLAVLERCARKVELETEGHNAAEQLRHAKEAAEAASRAMSEFLANISHELRTPLNAVIGFSELMTNQFFGPLSDQYRDYARDIHASGTHLIAIINDILDLSKAAAGKLELTEEWVDVNRAVEAALRMLKTKANSAGIALETTIDAALPPLRGDELMLRRVLINLLGNAVKFTPCSGRIELAARLSGERRVEIVVKDTGIGMAREDIPKALEPFRQVDNRLARRYEGTGLGLPLSAAMVRLHGGELSIESELGRGTEVTISFPPERTGQPVEA